MSGIVPPIPPPLGTSSGSTGNPNANRVDMMTTNDTPNTIPTTNVSQSVVDENLPQLLDSRGGSHVTNVPNFDKDDFTSWKLSTSKNPLPKHQNQWSNAESRLANQDKRLKSIIIGCLPNDVMKSIIKCKTTKEMWNDLILAYEGPYDTRDTKIASLRLKFNAFKSLEGEKVLGTFTRLKCFLNDLENNGIIIPQAEANAMFVNSLLRKWLSMNQTQRENNSIKNDSLAALYGKYSYEEGLIDEIYESETQRTSNEFMADLNVEYQERALLANQKRFYKRTILQTKLPHHLIHLHIIPTNPNLTHHPSTKHLPRILPIIKRITRENRRDLKLRWRIDYLTKGKSEKGKNEKGKSKKGLIAELFDWDKEYVSSEDKGTIRIRAFMAIVEDEPYVRKADARFRQWVDITIKRVNLENESLKDEISDLKKETIPPLPKLIGAAPASTSDSLISLSNLTLNMADLTLNIAVPKKTKPTSGNVAPVNIIKKKTENKPPAASDKKADSSTKQLFLTLMEEVKGLKKQIEIPLDYLKRYSKEPGPKVIFEDDSSGDTEGYGSVKYNGITFTRVAYVNGLKHKLISISQLCDANFKVLFTKTQGTIFNQNDEVVLISSRRRNVYIIDMSSYNKESNTCFFSKASPSVNGLWNKRLSHLIFKNINNLAKHNLVSRLPSLTLSKDKNYSACEKRKHHRASFKTKRSFSINKSLHLLHMDLFGPVKPQTISHDNYTLVIVDEYSRYTWVFCLKKKSDAADCIMSFIKMENLNEVRVKELRSDNETEFKNHKLKEFYDEKGIFQNFSSPCTPEQNGVAERKNRTLIEAAMTMLNSIKLLKQFWGEAVNTAYYTQNRSIIVKRHGKTSYDVFRGRSPDISYFHVFGCLVHIHNHKDHLGKFDENADDEFFLGYSPVAKAFRKGMLSTLMKTDPSQMMNSLNPRVKTLNVLAILSTFPTFLHMKTPHPLIYPLFRTLSLLKNPLTKIQDNIINEPINDVQPTPILSPLAEGILQPPVAQDRWSREKHIELVNIIGEPLAGITTRSRVRDSEAALAHECLYVNFLSKMEPKKLIEALEEEEWIIAMQKELNQFERNKVWTLVPKPHGLEAIRIFLAYAAYMGFMVYQMDVKSAFLNGKISEEVYVQQPPGFESSEFPNHVCKLDKALYGLKQAPRAWYETLSKFLIQHKFVRAIRPDIQFSTCLCARYQANPKESHLIAVKRIFRYHKGTPNLGLWYPKRLGFDLKAYSNSDYTRCNLDRKSTSGGCQILGGKLVCWSAKKQSSVAMSSAKAEYVAAAGCCAQVLWIKSQLANYDVLYDKVPIFCDNTSAIAISNNPVLHFRTKHIDIKHHFIRDHILKGDIKLHFVPTNLQLADIFTKPLAEPSFTRLVAELGMLNI
ncbi:retrovirus-related pol polyprotein from transposon TNT 1-94 [Tanacetum coccineum]